MWVLETILNVKVSSETCMHNFISAHWLACTSLSVDKDLDQTTVGCAGKLVLRALGKKPRCIHMAHCHSSTPEALIEKHRNHGELLGLTYHSDPLQTMMCGHCLKNRESKLVASASGVPSSQGLSPTQAAPCSLRRQPEGSCCSGPGGALLLVSRSPRSMLLPVEYWLLFLYILLSLSLIAS